MPKAAVQASRSWTCLLCSDHPSFESSRALMDHCEEKHREVPVVTVPDQGGEKRRRIQDVTRRMSAHLDGADFYLYTFTWSLASGQDFAAETEISPRRGRSRHA